MYHTEGFVNKHTINMKEHIIMLALEEKGCPWYLWCVLKKTIADTDVLKQVLSFWLRHTLLTNGCSNETSAQRELNRLGGYLQNLEASKMDIEDVRLFMYYQGKLYGWENESAFRGESAQDRTTYRKISEGIYGFVSEEGLWEDYNKHRKKEYIKVEELANMWEMSLVEACSNGIVEDGFFFIWEDTVDFSKR